MTNVHRHGTAWAMLAMTGLACLPALSDQTPLNLLKNGGFEELAGELPADWFYVPMGEETVRFAASSDKPKDGERCLRITGTGKWAAASSEMFPVDHAKRYTLSAYTRVVKGQAVVKFDYYQGGEHLGQTLSPAVDASEGWKQLTVDAETAKYPAATHLQVTLGVLGEMDCAFDGTVLTAK